MSNWQLTKIKKVLKLLKLKCKINYKLTTNIKHIYVESTNLNKNKNGKHKNDKSKH